MKSHTLSGWPSVTDSDVKMKGWPFGPDCFSLTGRPPWIAQRTPARARNAAPGTSLPRDRPGTTSPAPPGARSAPWVAPPGCRARTSRAAPNVHPQYSGRGGRGQPAAPPAGRSASPRRRDGLSGQARPEGHRGADAVGGLVEVGLVLEAEDGGVASAHHLRHQERDADAALGEGPRDAVGEARAGCRRARAGWGRRPARGRRARPRARPCGCRPGPPRSPPASFWPGMR